MVQKLKYHNLTVTDISFSHDGQHILLVSRDRTWSLFSNIEGLFKFKTLEIKPIKSIASKFHLIKLKFLSLYRKVRIEMFY